MNLKIVAIRKYANDHSAKDTERFIRLLFVSDTPKDDHGHWFDKEGAPCPHKKENGNSQEERTEEKSGVKEMKCSYGNRRPYFNGYGIEHQYDVTDEYKKGSKPGSGAFYVMRGVNRKHNINEINIGKKIHETIGGDVIVLEETKKDKEGNPDYFWRKGLWDLKTPEQPTYNAFDQRVESGLKQTKPNMSGIVFSLAKCKLSIDKAIPLINDAINNRAQQNLDVIIFNEDASDYRVIRYKIKKAPKKTRPSASP